MTVALPVSAEPATVPETPQQLGLWRRLPTKAKVGAVMMGVFIIFGSSVIATAAAVFERILQNAVDIKSENDLTV